MTVPLPGAACNSRIPRREDVRVAVGTLRHALMAPVCSLLLSILMLSCGGDLNPAVHHRPPRLPQSTFPTNKDGWAAIVRILSPSEEVRVCGFSATLLSASRTPPRARKRQLWCTTRSLFPPALLPRVARGSTTGLVWAPCLPGLRFLQGRATGTGRTTALFTTERFIWH